ncbi:MAG: HicB family protein [Ezakiella sp.]|nr:HicB family protein [Ezakiella sp.]
MEKQNYITYLTVFRKEEGGYSIEIPAIDGYTCSDTIEEGIRYVQEVISLNLYDREVYPDDVKLEDIELNEGDKVIYVSLYLPYEFSLVKEVYKNKMVTLPTWIEALAKNKNINFSKVLTEGLKKELNIK